MKKRQWTIRVCTECGERSPWSGHWHDTPSDDDGPKRMVPTEDIKVVPASEHEEFKKRLIERIDPIELALSGVGHIEDLLAAGKGETA